VALIRDGEGGLETWMMRRVKGMAFAAGAAVFPGGRVDAGDADLDVHWTGADPESFATRLGVDQATARQLVTGALRELFEETGVLLAEPLPGVDLEQARVAVENRNLSLSRLLAEHGSRLSVAGLHPWARWVTPAVEKRRYDTWFFVAALPAGVEAQAVSSEADLASWIPVTEVLASAAAGETLLMPPTISVLSQLAALENVPAVLAAVAGRNLAAVHPQIRRHADGSIDVLADGQVFALRIP
jgi:8-oxo-dGTP pyrophosphatase MutT (NUDIX family)